MVARRRTHRFHKGHWADTQEFAEAVEVYVMNADGSDPTQVTDNEAAELSVAWSPDGDRLAVHRDAFDKPHVVVIDLATADEVDVTHDDAPPDSGIDWSHATDRLLFTSSLSGGNLWTMTPQGEDLQELLVDGAIQPRFPVWSPDGTRIAFTGQSFTNLYGSGEPQASALYVIPAEGGDMEEVVGDRWLIAFPDWVPR